MIERIMRQPVTSCDYIPKVNDNTRIDYPDVSD